MKPGRNSPEAALVLAAGLGRRMLPLTKTQPKALLKVCGRTLLDHAIERACEAGARRVVVNTHHFAEKMRLHVSARTGISVAISEEIELLDTGGGTKAALPLLGTDPFLVINCDAIWTGSCPLEPLVGGWLETDVDALLLLVPHGRAVAHAGEGDFELDRNGRIRRAGNRAAAYIYTGAQILNPSLFEEMPEGTWSINRLWDAAMAESRAGGVLLEKFEWVDTGTPAGLEAAESALAADHPAVTKWP